MKKGADLYKMAICPKCQQESFIEHQYLYSKHEETKVVLSFKFTARRAHPPLEDNESGLAVWAPIDVGACSSCGHVELSLSEPEELAKAIREARAYADR